jgi:hypothetical protein
VTGLVAAGVTGVLVMSPAVLPAGDDAHAPAASAAAAVLEQAARSAQRLPALRVPRGSYVYTETTSVDHVGPDAEADPASTYKPGLTIREDRRTWESAYGDRPGLVQALYRPELPGAAWQDIPLDGPQGSGAYLRDLPTTTQAMTAYIYAHADGQNGRHADAFTAVGDLLRTGYVPPDRLAALFRAAGKIRGTTVVRGERDILGRPAVAVAWENPTASIRLLFDPATFAYLGEKTVLTKTGPGGPKGALTWGFARKRLAVAPTLGTIP